MSTEAAEINAETLDVIRAAIAASSAGRHAEACAIGERGLARGGDAGSLHALLGALYRTLGDTNAALPHLRAARTTRPNDPIIQKNLARLLCEVGAYLEVVELVTEHSALSDATMDLLRLRGFALQMSENYLAAISAYEKLLTLAPGDWETWNNLGNARMSYGQKDAGITALRRATELNPLAASARMNLAHSLREAGDVVGSERELRQIADEFTDDSAALLALFELLLGQGKSDECEHVLNRAAARDPANVVIQVALGRQQLLRFANHAAECTFRRALRLDPRNEGAFLGLADALEHHRPLELPALLAEVEAAKIDEAPAGLIRSMVALRQRHFAEGAIALEDVPADYEPIQRWHLAGQMYEGMGKAERAFEAFTRMNEALAAEPGNPLARAAQVRVEARDQLARTTAEWRESWATPSVEPVQPTPVFLVGFPRSGTTLLDTMLMGHSKVEVMEERPILQQLRFELGGFDAIADMGGNDVHRAQSRYFEIARRFAKLDREILIVKSPLHMQNVPQIYRLFPSARFILALRHPADVVLSCFMSNFRLNPAMANFLQLETSAEFYDLTFSMWNQAISLFPVELYPVVYEELLADPESVLKTLLSGLRLPWDARVLDHVKSAEDRGPISTASYAQVVRPLYGNANGRWRRYQKQLEPVLPVLRPWIEKYGYNV